MNFFAVVDDVVIDVVAVIDVVDVAVIDVVDVAVIAVDVVTVLVRPGTNIIKPFSPNLTDPKFLQNFDYLL